jgi:hypothetical protein
MSDNPFSIQDFLGYFFPGATVLIALYYYVPDIKELLPFGKEEMAMVYVISLITAYVLGHVVALLSSITVEKYVIWRYGYPSKFLLKSYSRHRYFLGERMNNSDIKEKRQKQYLRRKAIVKAIVLVVIAPISLLDALLSWRLGIDYYFTRRLPNQQVSMIRAKSTNLFKKLNIYSSNRPVFQEDFHRIIHNYYFEKASGHSRRMENCIAIYDFLRAMSFVFVVLFFVALGNGVKSIDFSMPLDWVCILFILGYAVLSYVCYMGFMKFYRKFTVENFMCLICDGELDIVNVVSQSYNPTTGNQDKQENSELTVNLS